MRFCRCGMHVEGFARSRRSEAEEVGVVRYLILAFLTADVNGYRDTLSVCIVDFQRCFLAMLNVLLLHETSSCITESEEPVVVLVHAVAVARE